MNVALWVIAGLLAAAFLGSGLMKVSRPKEKLAASGMKWTDDFGSGTVKLIGTLEILGAVGLILPGVTGIATVLVPLAAVGLALIMVGAAVIHRRRGEAQMIVGNIGLLVLAAFVAWGRFGPYPLS
jgi:DoxX-like family